MKYVPIDKRGIRLNVGIRTLSPMDWFECDENFASTLENKTHLMATVPQDVHAELPIAQAAIDEFLPLALANLNEFHGSCDHMSSNTIAHFNSLSDVAVLIQEDVCILNRTEAGWILSAAHLCAPSRWSLHDKLGKNLRNIHAPVPHYQEVLGEAVDFTFDRMTPERQVYRLNWTLLDDAELFQPAVTRNPHVTQDNVGESVFFRVERQTLTRLPQSDGMVFTIRTYVDSLADVVNSHPDACSLLANAVETAELEEIEYKGWHHIRQFVLDYVGRIDNSAIAP
jgi:hypothetical protein